jgi:hypothetical protein
MNLLLANLKVAKVESRAKMAIDLMLRSMAKMVCAVTVPAYASFIVTYRHFYL